MNEKEKAEILTSAKHLILTHRDGLYNVALTIAGGALVLSPNLIDDTISKNYLIVLKFSWTFLVISIISNLLLRFRYTEKTIKKINHEEKQRDDVLTRGFYSLIRQFQNGPDYTTMSKSLLGIFWDSFILGIILLLLYCLTIY